MARHFRSQNECEKSFVEVIDKLCYNRQRWQVWEDLITVIACSISIAVDRQPDRMKHRCKDLEAAIERMGGPELPGKAFDAVIDALETNPNQDFLGAMYMRLGLGDHYKGQFFTPYHLSDLMAQISTSDLKQKMELKGWISVCDSCIGGGAMLIAAANTAKSMGINYQQNILFVGQDIDRIVGMMAYIQLSLLGCPGYIVIANSITNPIVGDPLMPAEREGQEFWYTPFYFREAWKARRQIRIFEDLMHEFTKKPQKTVEKDDFTFFFDFTGGNEDGRTECAG